MKATCLAILTSLIVTFDAQTTYSQTGDSSSTSMQPGGAIQFQLIGGTGLDYIGYLNQSSSFRVGIDFSFNHSTQSGNQSSYYSYSPTQPPASSGDTTISENDLATNSYSLTLSGLYIQNLTEYGNAFLYCGVGPMLVFSLQRNAWTNQSSTNLNWNNSESSSKTSGLGPIAILGARGKLCGQIEISGEIGVSATYQWNTFSSFSNSGAIDLLNTSLNSSSSISHLNGWVFSFTHIRVGVIVDL